MAAEHEFEIKCPRCGAWAITRWRADDHGSLRPMNLFGFFERLIDPGVGQTEIACFVCEAAVPLPRLPN